MTTPETRTANFYDRVRNNVLARFAGTAFLFVSGEVMITPVVALAADSGHAPQSGEGGLIDPDTWKGGELIQERPIQGLGEAATPPPPAPVPAPATAETAPIVNQPVKASSTSEKPAANTTTTRPPTKKVEAAPVNQTNSQEKSSAEHKVAVTRESAPEALTAPEAPVEEIELQADLSTQSGIGPVGPILEPQSPESSNDTRRTKIAATLLAVWGGIMMSRVVREDYGRKPTTNN